MGNVILYDADMNEITMRGITWLEFSPEPPAVDSNIEKVHHGDIVLGRTRNSRLIQAKLWMKAYDKLDFKLLRDELYSHLDPSKDFYAVDEDVPGRRWKVQVRDININRVNGTTAEMAVVFYCPKGLAESIHYTLDEFDTDPGKWATGMGLVAEVEEQKYSYSQNLFSIFNAGNIEVDPRESNLLITIRAVNGGTGTISITNPNTSEIWRYEGPVNAGDVFRIDGVKSTRNFMNVVGQTNLGLISLRPGSNAISVSGLNAGFVISFDFRFLYL